MLGKFGTMARPPEAEAVTARWMREMIEEEERRRREKGRIARVRKEIMARHPDVFIDEAEVLGEDAPAPETAVRLYGIGAGRVCFECRTVTDYNAMKGQYECPKCGWVITNQELALGVTTRRM